MNFFFTRQADFFMREQLPVEPGGSTFLRADAKEPGKPARRFSEAKCQHLLHKRKRKREINSPGNRLMITLRRHSRKFELIPHIQQMQVFKIYLSCNKARKLKPVFYF